MSSHPARRIAALSLGAVIVLGTTVTALGADRIPVKSIDDTSTSLVNRIGAIDNVVVAMDARIDRIPRRPARESPAVPDLRGADRHPGLPRYPDLDHRQPPVLHGRRHRHRRCQLGRRRRLRRRCHIERADQSAQFRPDRARRSQRPAGPDRWCIPARPSHPRTRCRPQRRSKQLGRGLRRDRWPARRRYPPAQPLPLHLTNRPGSKATSPIAGGVASARPLLAR